MLCTLSTPSPLLSQHKASCGKLQKWFFFSHNHLIWQNGKKKEFWYVLLVFKTWGCQLIWLKSCAGQNLGYLTLTASESLEGYLNEIKIKDLELGNFTRLFQFLFYTTHHVIKSKHKTNRNFFVFKHKKFIFRVRTKTI